MVKKKKLVKKANPNSFNFNISNKKLLMIFIIIFISIASLAIYFIGFDSNLSDMSLNNQNKGNSNLEIDESSGLTGGITLEITPPPPRKVTLTVMSPPEEVNNLEK